MHEQVSECVAQQRKIKKSRKRTSNIVLPRIPSTVTHTTSTRTLSTKTAGHGERSRLACISEGINCFVSKQRYPVLELTHSRTLHTRLRLHRGRGRFNHALSLQREKRGCQHTQRGQRKEAQACACMLPRTCYSARWKGCRLVLIKG
jgi:hypothetical protein